MARKKDWRDRAKAIMEEREMSVRDLSLKLKKTTQNTYQLLDLPHPNLATLKDFAKARGCKVTDLVEGL